MNIVRIGDKECGNLTIDAQANSYEREKVIHGYKAEYAKDGWHLDSVTHNIGATKFHLHFSRLCR
jgi:hypothetical protein